LDVRSWGILDFIKSSTQFVIPIYQRNYAWGDKQCEQLLTDVRRAGEHDSIQSHFTGSVVYIQQNNSASIGGSWLLIDGQQRLTTVLLMLEAIKRKIGDNTYAGLNEAIITQYYLINNLEQGDKKYKLLLADNDRETLIAILHGTEKELKYKSNNIIDNLNFFLKNITDENIEIFARGLAKLAIVGIALNKDVDNPQLIFESMNSAGKSLSQADLIRNFVLMGLDQHEQETLYHRYWRPMEKEFGQVAYETDFDIFMRHYLASKLYTLPKKDEVYDTFKFYVHSRELEAEEVLSDIKRNAHYFTVMMYGSESADSQINNKVRPVYQNIISGLKKTVAIPTLLTLHRDYEEETISIDELLECLNVLESYLFRRSVVEAPTNVLNSMLASLPDKIDRKAYVESFKHFFLDSELAVRKFPNDHEFKEAFMRRDFYGAFFAKYTFDKLENHGFKEKTDVSKYTIEHVMPQNPEMSDEWKNELGEDYERVWEEYLHRIANLTLTGYNSEYSDKPFKEKLHLTDFEGKRIGLATSTLRLNAFFRDTTIWNEEVLEKRTEELAQRALEIWKKPTTNLPLSQGRKTKKTYDVSLTTLIENGYLNAGETLYSTEQKYPGSATLEADGTLTFNGEPGLNISDAGGKCRRLINPEISKPNGWEFWAISNPDGGLKSLIEIREDYLANK
jgi:uncharacterized protein with ParB-like and HNH nuclease domain